MSQVGNKLEAKSAALWTKKTKTGNDYYSVKVDMPNGDFIWVNLFWNRNKKTDKQPDFKTIDQDQVPRVQSGPPPLFDTDDGIPT